MSVRETHKPHDIQTCMYELIGKLISDTSPWTGWERVYGWPEEDVFSQFTKPFLYILSPRKTAVVAQQGGGATAFRWEMTIGAWVDRNVGGPDELTIMEGRLIQFFGNPNTCHTKTFTVILGDTTYTSKTLLNMGISIENINGPNELTPDDLKEFRSEFDIEIIA